MHDSIHYADDLLVSVSGEFHSCASEAVKPDDDWQDYPWQPWTHGGCALSGQIVASDDHHYLFLSGADYFRLPKSGARLLARGQDAVLPADLLVENNTVYYVPPDAEEEDLRAE